MAPAVFASVSSLSICSKSSAFSLSKSAQVGSSDFGSDPTINSGSDSTAIEATLTRRLAGKLGRSNRFSLGRIGSVALWSDSCEFLLVTGLDSLLCELGPPLPAVLVLRSLRLPFGSDIQ